MLVYHHFKTYVICPPPWKKYPNIHFNSGLVQIKKFDKVFYNDILPVEIPRNAVG
jgi:hypothetical protein